MSSRDHRRADPEVSFDGVVDLGSLPPPAVERTDVYRSQTAVTTMTDTLKDEIQRAREEAKLHETEKTRVVPKFEMPDDAIPGFMDEAPTRPGKESVPEKSGAVRRQDLPAVMVSEPEERVTIDITPVLAALPPEPASAPAPAPFAEATPSIGETFAPIAPSLVPAFRRAIWPRVLVVLVTLATLFVAAFALHQYRASSGRP